MTPEQRLRGARVAVVDTETTGTGRDARIVEVGVVLIDRLFESEPLIVVSELVDPEVPIPWHASKVHGIRDRHVRGRPRWRSVWPKVREALEGAVLCAFNAGFDHRLLEQEHTRCGILYPLPGLQDWLDPYPVVRRMDPKRWTLQAACDRRGIPRGGHRAASDALATAHLLHRQIREVYTERPELGAPKHPSVMEWLAWQRGELVSVPPAPAPSSAPLEVPPSPVPRASEERSRRALSAYRRTPTALEGQAVCLPCSRLHPSPRHVLWHPHRYGTPQYEARCVYCEASSAGHEWGASRHLPTQTYLDVFGKPQRRKTGRLADLAAEAPPAPADLEEVDA